MSSLYTPVFFPPPPKQSIVSSQPTGSQHIPGLSATFTSASSSHPLLPNPTPNPKPAKDKRILKLSAIHLALSRLQPELCPPSPPRYADARPLPLSLDPYPDPTLSTAMRTENRVEQIRAQVQAAVEQAEGDRSSGKWGQVTQLLRLGCTQGKWSYEEAIKAERERGLPRAGVDASGAPAGHQWVLPATEDEWAALEAEYERKLEDGRLNLDRSAGKDGDGNGNGRKDADVGKVLLGNGRPAEHIIRARVKEWQRELTAADASHPPPPSLPPSSSSMPLGKLASVENISHEGPAVAQPRPQRRLRARARPASVPAKKSTAAGERAKGKTGRVQVVQQQPAQLGFPVVKRASVTSAGSKPSQEQKEKDKGKGKEKEKDGLAKEKEKGTEQEKRKDQVSSLREEAEDEQEVENSVRIESADAADEKGPVGAPTTPQIHDVSEMSFLPPSFPSNMLTSTPNPRAASHKPESIPKIPHDAPPVSSPLSSPPDYDGMPPPSKSPKRPAKRARESIVDIPVPANVFRDSESVWFTPPAKKARIEIEPEPGVAIEQDQEQEQARPSTPKPSSPTTKPTTPKERVRTLPTLTELLASSKQTPNAKSVKLPTRTFKAFVPAKDAGVDAGLGDASASPASKAVAARPAVNEPPRTPDPSPTKSMFSFASGSTESPSHGHYAPFRSPSSPSLPLSLTQNPGLFSPQAMSTQPGASGARSQGAGSSGFLVGAGFYNSQFDADRAAERASALLEKDVNFDLWLRSDEEGDDDGHGVQDEINELEGDESR